MLTRMIKDAFFQDNKILILTNTLVTNKLAKEGSFYGKNINKPKH